MNITDTKALIKKLLNAPEKERFVLCLKGHQGIGKTQAIQQVAEENGWNYKALYGAQTQVEDLMGIPYLKENNAIKENNEGEKISKFAKPILFPDKPKTIFVLEEINRAPLDVQQAILQLLTENKFAGRELPQDTVIIVSINPSDVNSGYNVEKLDSVFINRICMIDVEPELKEWLDYANDKNFNKRIRAFLSNPKNNWFFWEKPNYENIGQSLPSPRTWEIVSKILKIENEKITFLDNLLKGVIGQEATIEFLNDWADIGIDGKDILTAQYDRYSDLRDNKLNNQTVSQNAYSLTSLKGYIESQNYKLSSEQKVRVWIL
ncbi:AAA family ATPase [Candidatus Ruminimicrobium bovinum]|uniref:AAA family ATPase n=1 Tax=Candidatus Ruminimicrobium bovinum TaxID=3242779 RepID=UPI0039B94B41